MGRATTIIPRDALADLFPSEIDEDTTGVLIFFTVGALNITIQCFRTCTRARFLFRATCSTADAKQVYCCKLLLLCCCWTNVETPDRCVRNPTFMLGVAKYRVVVGTSVPTRWLVVGIFTNYGSPLFVSKPIKLYFAIPSSCNGSI